MGKRGGREMVSLVQCRVKFRNDGDLHNWNKHGEKGSRGGKQSEAGSNLIKKLLFSDQITRRSS